jgi:hypothetical protein
MAETPITPHPYATPVTKTDGTVAIQWSSYFTTQQSLITALTTRIAALEARVTALGG